MAREYLFSKAPEGLLNFELVALLGFLLVDSNFRVKLLGMETIDGNVVPARDAVQKYLGDALSKVNNEATDQNGGKLLAHWGKIGEDKTTRSKATIEDLLAWADANRTILDCLMENLKKFLNTQHPPTSDLPADNYSQCDFKAYDVVELLESARIMSWRRLL
jgi:hypothetical protein